MSDPKLDLVLERVVDIAPELVWAAWTQPKHVVQWFTPSPWKTIDCEIDLRPGGVFRTLMESPEGKTFPNLGCYLEVVPNRRLSWTNALGPGFRPARKDARLSFDFTATVALEPHETGTKYTATVIHRDESDRKKHDEMGFHAGWSQALAQLVAHMKNGAT